MAIIRLISAGAPQSGVVACMEVYTADTGARFEPNYMTSPEIRKVMEGTGDKPEILVAPGDHMKGYGAVGLLDVDSLVTVGDVEAGVVIRSGADFPNIGTTDELRNAILAADQVLYNDAISGQYIETMIEGLGIAECVADKTERLPSAALLMERIGKGAGTEIGFGQIPAVKRLSEHGVVVVGPLPEGLRKTTTYVAGVINSHASRSVKGFLGFLETPRAREILHAAGIT